MTPSTQAKGTKSTSFLTHSCVRNEVDLVLLACAYENYPKRKSGGNAYLRLDQALHVVEPDLGPNGLQMLSAENKSCH